MRLKPLFIFCITFLFIGYVTYASSPDHLGLRHDINSADSAEDGVDPISDKDTLVRLVKYAKYCDLVGKMIRRFWKNFPRHQSM